MFSIATKVNYLGRPGAPVIITNVHQMLMPESKELNISWTTDSFAPITAYFLYYRKNQVQLA